MKKINKKSRNVKRGCIVVRHPVRQHTPSIYLYLNLYSYICIYYLYNFVVKRHQCRHQHRHQHRSQPYSLHYHHVVSILIINIVNVIVIKIVNVILNKEVVINVIVIKQCRQHCSR